MRINILAILFGVMTLTTSAFAQNAGFINEKLTQDEGLSILVKNFAERNNLNCELSTKHTFVYAVENSKGFSAFFNCGQLSSGRAGVRVEGNLETDSISFFQITFLK